MGLMEVTLLLFNSANYAFLCYLDALKESLKYVLKSRN